MNIPASEFSRPRGARRRVISLSCLLAGLLVPLSFACAQTAANRTVSPVSPAGRTDRQPELAEFNVWAARYAKAQSLPGASAPSAATLAEGVRLAARRKAIIAALIQTHPSRALAAGISAGVRANLPASVLSQLESPFSAVGDLTVDDSSGRREITVDGQTYAAHAFGQQLSMASQRGVSLRGVVLDGQAVLNTDVPRDLATAPDDSHPRKAPRPQTVYGNDPFGGALQLFDNSGSVNDDNLFATKEPGEPNHAGNGGGASVWYTWTPTNSGQATFSTDDGINNVTVDTLLAVYTGFDVADLTAVAFNDDAVGYNSQVTFMAQAGTTYYIAVDGYLYSTGPSEGNFTLTYFQQGDPFSPQITSDTVADGEVNTPFLYTITATNTPTSFTASGLPTGLTLDPATGVISGTVTTIGYYIVIISASNDLGTGTNRLTISVSDQPIHLPFFRTEVALPQSPGLYYLHLPRGNIFGYYGYFDDPNFIYHLDLGYEYTFDAQDGQSGIFFYDFASGSYFYTSPRFPFPYMYDFTLNAFLYYFPDPRREGRYNTNGVRYFYNFSTGEIITK